LELTFKIAGEDYKASGGALEISEFIRLQGVKHERAPINLMLATDDKVSTISIPEGGERSALKPSHRDKRHKSWTPTEDATLREAKAKGLPDAKIGKVIGRSTGAVSQRWSALNKQRPGPSHSDIPPELKARRAN
jgi:hypothetical protein